MRKPKSTENDIRNDPQLMVRNMIVEMEHIQAGRIKTAGIPLKFSDVECIIERPAPLLGQHSQEVFKEFGLVTRKLLNYSLELLSRLMQPNIETDVTN